MIKSNEDNIVKNLIGRKVNIDVTEHEYGKNKTLYKKYTVNDKKFEQEIDAIAIENQIFPPGTMGTMDFKPYRLNVYINEEGVVTRADYG